MPGRNPLQAEVVEESPPLDEEAVARAAAPPPGPPAVVRAPTRGGTVVYQPLTELDPVTSVRRRRRPATCDGGGTHGARRPARTEARAARVLEQARRALRVRQRQPLPEGDTTREGTQVEEITRDGVVMNLRGNRFLLPRE